MKKILIIEDEKSYARLLRDKLTESGYDVIEANDGEIGLQLAQLEKPDLIILDIMLPGISGVTVLGDVRKQPNGNQTKVIMLTNLEPDENILSTVLIERPAFYFIKSNISIAELLDKIEDLLTEDRSNAQP